MKKVLAFVAIVWGVAASFIIVERGFLAATDLAQAYPQLFGSLLLSRATQESRACEVGPQEHADHATGDLNPSDVRVWSWMLGLRVGEEAQARQAKSDASGLATARADVAAFASRLHAPVPDAFGAKRLAEANTEFASSIETDPHGTAHALAVSYSAQACRLYKLGALWGYALLPRAALPGEASIYAQEIRLYSTQVGLPDMLSQSMLERTPADAAPVDLYKQGMTLTDQVTRYLSATK